MLIVYCNTCGKRIADAELNSGKARKIAENEFACGECARPVEASAPPPQPARRPSTAGSPTQARPQRITKQIPARKSGHAAEAVRGAEPKAKSSNPTVLIGAGIGVVAIGILVFALQSSNSPPQTAAPTSAADPPVKTDGAKPPPAPATAAAKPNLPAPTAQSSAPRATPPQAVQPPRNPGTEMEDLRDDLAAEKLRDAKQYASAHPDDPWAYKDKLEALTGSYRSTPAGKEALGLLANLKVPEKPAPPPPPELPKGTGDWQMVVGPDKLDGIIPEARKDWQSVDGAVEKKPNTDNAAQSSASFGDGEFRVRFETHDASNFYFVAHQAGEAMVGIHIYRAELQKSDGKQRELLFTCAGDRYKATLDGAVMELDRNGSPRQGRIQFNSREGVVKIFSIEFRPLEKH